MFDIFWGRNQSIHIIFTLMMIHILRKRKINNFLYDKDYIFYMLPLNGCYGVCLSNVTVVMAAALEVTSIWVKFYLVK